ncbi:uncharacterized protein PGTG_10125 [Puccinia graminis f. sp. tritici CRL 75-36-700-3]|uniref:Uncharacterized protein n=1 Tax=Puccinia graminis f. sp. tritici (strain CRL 75-36-700-3 / race SCCL) TaxID=418459 RepID=E3KJD0_PUCGT|nr:uncharacterized protein PGTG_10125 [Puccinia graminis f. sp. tritici CRL 75-36-700-3]EFP84405.2 hypothetical protein PGTG_10125 [Puccinia graminis f. sp. tritici CRL 75-36-700-3]
MEMEIRGYKHVRGPFTQNNNGFLTIEIEASHRPGLAPRFEPITTPSYTITCNPRALSDFLHNKGVWVCFVGSVITSIVGGPKRVFAHIMIVHRAPSPQFYHYTVIGPVVSGTAKVVRVVGSIATLMEQSLRLNSYLYVAGRFIDKDTESLFIHIQPFLILPANGEIS